MPDADHHDHKTEQKLLFDHLNGNYIRTDLKNYINRLVDRGEFESGYEVAIKGGELTAEEEDELLVLLAERNRSFMPNAERAMEVIARLGKMRYMNSYLLVGDTVLFSNGFHVFLIDNGVVRWDSGRIAIDGIDGLTVYGDQVSGRAFYPNANDGEWREFRLNLATGGLSKGWQWF